MQKDNSTFKQKRLLRLQMLKHVDAPVIMETHGGKGALFKACYSDVAAGVVLEKDRGKVEILARQRPTWAVYEVTDSAKAIAGGAGNHLPVNVLDVDPYGDPWPTIEAFFSSERERPDKVFVVVNDGLKSKVNIGAWDVGTLAPMVQKYGNNLSPIYLEVCKELMAEKAAQAGYGLSRWVGYYCGHARQMTHYLAILERA